MKPRAFISYAREDRTFAEKLYKDLQQAGVSPWLDIFDLTPGIVWKKAIRKAISESSCFLPILSSRSVRKRGFVQWENRFALEIAKEYPEDQVFILPLRIDECQPSFEDFKVLHFTDLFPSYENGFQRLLRYLLYLKEEKPALVLIDSERWGGTIMSMRDRGFGFIKYNIIRSELFFHSKELVGITFEELDGGDIVTFQIAKGPKGLVAVNVAKA